jgi:hypothetical protein
MTDGLFSNNNGSLIRGILFGVGSNIIVIIL